MPGYFQQTIAIGLVGRDAELHTTVNGKSFAVFSLVVMEQGVDQMGQSNEIATWYSCSAWDEGAQKVHQVIRKGMNVMVIGSLSARAYQDNNGQPKASLDLRLQNFKLLGNFRLPQQATQPTAPLPDPTPIEIGFRTSRTGWQHMIDLMQRDTDPAWTQFNAQIVTIITNGLPQTPPMPSIAPSTPSVPPRSKQWYDNDPEEARLQREYEAHLKARAQREEEAIQQHQEDIAEQYGSYDNYRRYSSDASDIGFDDVDDYLNWLDD